MSVLATLLGFPLMGPLGGLSWIAGKLHEAVLAEALDPARIEAGLRKLEKRLDAGEITEEEYDTQEAALLAELRAIRAALAERAA